MIKKLRTALSLTAASLLTGVGIVAVTALPAHAKSVYNDNVGQITGYSNTSTKDYTGTKIPSYNGFCVLVQRKTKSTNQWVVDGIRDAGDCSASDNNSPWSIIDNGYYDNTKAIRLYRPSTGGYVVLCVDEPSCRAM